MGDMTKIITSIVLSSAVSAAGAMMVMKIEIAVIKNDISYIKQSMHSHNARP